ncbi:putative quinol monooxygenase [Parahaliea aestuarii]|uniref:Antibiotic biosynthesis monooxygenase n=1 Tax=Parahaliea aestuarii TaxID=1852021 RepID=A0A5C9A502_9GAMM|nr:putative quinol monooxygenase [Parahaliea aestuarii]TXS95062.1 antibiotic biosynthesis monooxygenase [Parahaliea aestuarii]
MIAITARAEISSADADAFVEAARQIVEPTLKEAGCQWYAMARDICNSNVVWISEQWESQEHLFAHLRSAHIRQFMEKTASLEIISLEPRQYEVTSVGPVQMPED